MNVFQSKCLAIHIGPSLIACCFAYGHICYVSFSQMCLQLHHPRLCVFVFVFVFAFVFVLAMSHFPKCACNCATHVFVSLYLSLYLLCICRVWCCLVQINLVVFLGLVKNIFVCCGWMFEEGLWRGFRQDIVLSSYTSLILWSIGIVG